MFWQVPSWLDYLTIWNILTITAYVLAFTLFESATIIGLLLLISLIFPAKYFKEKFIAQSMAVVSVLSLAAFLLQRKMRIIYKLELWQLIVYPILVVLAMVLLIFVSSFIFDRVPILARFATAIADRMVIFAFIYVPLGLFGLIVVVLRNII